MSAEGERLFTAAEVQAAVEAVILFERARGELQLRLAAVGIEAAVRASRRSLRLHRHATIDEIARSLSVCGLLHA
jgi:hypothetical protein